ncbi:CBS domain-containing protein [Saprospira sp. CCB-QB6]|uniref:CBS domain-containing protein n=1 Tax=Saprospira sp. CCB-QB6 TaxID=3023936 RepID=UPI00234A5128|nr:CBS domain-containing protein [Saprospira sp. CCB-QB6]WCL81070.1 CBS domain-containing protein [Saprospira sp. CCB-QB6]
MSNLSDFMNRPVSDIMTTKIKALVPGDSLQKVQELFEQENIHHIPVVRYKELVGIISQSDFEKAIHGARLHGEAKAAADNQELLSKYTASDIMTTKVVHIAPTDKIGVAAELLLINYFHALPIITEEGELEGIVSSHDVLKAIYKKAYPSEDI